MSLRCLASALVGVPLAVGGCDKQSDDRATKAGISPDGSAELRRSVQGAVATASPTFGGLDTVITVVVSEAPGTVSFQSGGASIKWTGRYEPVVGTPSVEFSVEWSEPNLAVVNATTARVVIGKGAFAGAPSPTLLNDLGQLVGSITVRFGDGTVVGGPMSFAPNAKTATWRSINYPDGWAGLTPPQVGQEPPKLVLNRLSVLPHPTTPSFEQLMACSGAHYALEVRAARSEHTGASAPDAIEVDVFSVTPAETIIDGLCCVELRRDETGADPGFIVYRTVLATPLMLIDTVINYDAYSPILAITAPVDGRVVVTPRQETLAQRLRHAPPPKPIPGKMKDTDTKDVRRLLEVVAKSEQVPWNDVARAVVDTRFVDWTRAQLAGALFTRGDPVSAARALSELVEVGELSVNPTATDSERASGLTHAAVFLSALRAIQSSDAPRVDDAMRRRLLAVVAASPWFDHELVPTVVNYLEREARAEPGWAGALAAKLILSDRSLGNLDAFRLGSLLNEETGRVVAADLHDRVRTHQYQRLPTLIDALAATGASEHIASIQAVAEAIQNAGPGPGDGRVEAQLLALTGRAETFAVKLGGSSEDLLAWATGDGRVEESRRVWCVRVLIKRGVSRDVLRPALFAWRDRVKADAEKFQTEHAVAPARREATVRLYMTAQLGSVQEVAEQAGIIERGELAQPSIKFLE